MDRGCVEYFEISPVHASKKKPKEDAEEEEAPVLRLTQFTHSPKISFENVKLGHTKKKRLLVLNPKDQLQELYCEKYPSEKNGFVVSPLHSTIAPGQTIEVIIAWTPIEEGNVRELIQWKSSLGVRSQTVLLGTCVNPMPKRKKLLKKEPLRPHNSNTISNKTKAPEKVLAYGKPEVRRNFSARHLVGSENKPLSGSSKSKMSEEAKTFKSVEGNLKEATKRHVVQKPLKLRKNKENVKFSNAVCVEDWVDRVEYNVTESTEKEGFDQVYDTNLHSILRRDFFPYGSGKMETCVTETVSEEQNFNETIGYNEGIMNENILKVPVVPASPLRRQTYIKPLYDDFHSNFNKSTPNMTKQTKDETVTVTHWVGNFEEKKLETYSSEYETEEDSVWFKKIENEHSTFRSESSLQLSQKSVTSHHLNPIKEVFEDARKGIPSCDVFESPLRRQTYVKRSREAMESSDLEDVVSEKDLNVTINSLPSSDSPQTGQDNEKVELSIIENTPDIQRKVRFDDIRASCKNFLEKIGIMSEPPQPQNLSFAEMRSCPLNVRSYPELITREHSVSVPCVTDVNEELVSRQWSASVPCFTDQNIESQKIAFAEKGDHEISEINENDLMLTASVSSTSEYVTAPSTPVEYEECTLIDERYLSEFDCNKTQDFPTPKIGKIKSVDVNIVRQLLEQSLGIECNVDESKLNLTLSPDSLEGSNNLSSSLYNERKSSGDVMYPHQRLSNGTVVLEDSILHPDDLINIDEVCSEEPIIGNEVTGNFITSPLKDLSFEIESIPPSVLKSLVKGSSFKGEMISSTSRDKIPVKDLSFETKFIPSSDIKIPVKCSAKNKAFESKSSATAIPIAQSLPPRKGLYQGLPVGTPENFNIKSKEPTISDTIASLADFSFLPGDDPKRCSTVIKSPTFQQVENADLLSKRKLFEEFIGPLDSKPAGNEVISSKKSEPFQKEFETFLKEKASDSEQPVNQIERLGTNAKIEGSEKGGLTFITISPPNHKANKRSNIDPKPAVKVSINSLKQSLKSKRPSVAAKYENKPLRKGQGNEKKLPMKAKSTLNLTTLKKESNSPNMDEPTSSLSTLNSLGTKSSASSSSSGVVNTTKDLKKTGLRKSRQFLSQSRLMLHKGPLSKVHHPNPFAARNMYYDDRWAEKQGLGFTKWLNFVLTPEEENVDHKVDIGKLWMEANRCSSLQKAPTREAMSLKTYTAKKRLGKLRRSAFKLYHTPEMAKVITKLEIAIEKKLLSIRKDRQSHIDVGLKQEMLKIALSYNPLWLRIGLETVFGEVIFLTSNTDINGLSFFIINRLLNCPDLASRYAHPTVPYSYRQGYEKDLKIFQLKRFLMLVYFLDKAKTSRLIDQDPCLFNKDSAFKTSRDVLLAFAREFLSGVGDITKHLAYLGYAVTHQQTPLDEFDFSVSNLAVDLRCGIRLTRVTEVLLQDFSLSKQLRLPAMSRLQKIHNVDLALKTLEREKVVSGRECYTPKDIVDGHLEKTLSLLWDIIFSLQIKNILSVTCLLEEINHLRKTLLVKGSFNSEAKRGMKIMTQLSKDFKNETESGKDSHSSEFILQLLKLWSRLVCAHYGLEVDNMTVSFCDGRAFCYILHHYHPEILQLEDINLKTTQNLPALTYNMDESMDECFLGEPYYDNQDIAQRLSKDKANFNVFIAKLNYLGGVPLLIRPADMVNTIPDEKVTTTFLAYLCARLLDLSAEIKAARVIQLAWRRKLAQIRLERIKREIVAAEKIQKWWRGYLVKRRAIAYEKAAIALQCHWRRVLAFRKLNELRYRKEIALKNKSATQIQLCVRRFLERRRLIKTLACISIQKTWKMVMQRRRFLKMKYSASKIQAFYRNQLTMRKYKMVRLAAIVIQRWWRSLVLERELADDLKFKNLCAIKIQATWRSYQNRRRFLYIKNSVIFLQSNVRRVIAQVNYKKRLYSIVTLQKYLKSWMLMKKERTQFLDKRAAAIKIQSFWRFHLIRLGYLDVIKCTIVIQSTFRMFLAKRNYNRTRNAVVGIQRRWRLKVEAKNKREQFLLMKLSAVVIQSAFRGWFLRKKYLNDYKKVVLLQSHVKGILQRRRFNEERNAALVIQSRYRSWFIMRQERKDFLSLRHQIILIQSQVRAYFTRKAYLKKLSACLRIQKFYRGYLARKEYHQKKKCVLIIEKYFLAYMLMKKERANFKELRFAALCIQRHWRGYRDRVIYRREINAIVIQAFFRGYMTRKWYNKLRESCLIIQKNLKMKRDMQKFAVKRNAAIRIQKCYWDWKDYKSKNAAAAKIQSAWKMHKERKVFLTLRNSALTFQSWFKVHLIRSNYLNKKKACIVLQSYFRMYITRKEYEMKREAAVTIQSWFLAVRKVQATKLAYHKLRASTILIQSSYRMWKKRKTYLAIKQSVLTVQLRLRATYAMKRDRENYLKKREAATKIQLWYSACRNCEMEMQRYLTLKRSAVVIQSYFRMWKQKRTYKITREIIIKLQRKIKERQWMKMEREKYLKQKRSAIVIQRWFVAIREGREQRKYYLNMKEASITIQSQFRMWKQRKLYVAKRNEIALLQMKLRATLQMRRDRENFLRLRNAATTIQAQFRCYNARINYKTKINACIKIQSWFRKAIMESRYKRIKIATVVLQRHLKNYLAYKAKLEENRILEATLIIQKNYRMSIMRNFFLKNKKAALVIQKNFRAYRGRYLYQQFYMNVCIVQDRFRALLKTKKTRVQFLNMKLAAIVIQKYVRGYLQKRRYQTLRASAIIIQAQWRMKSNKNMFILEKNAAIRIQRFYHNLMLTRMCVQEYQNQRSSVILLQAFVRGFLARIKIIKKNAAAVTLQKSIRRYLVKEKFKKQKLAALTIQRKFRDFKNGKIVREQFLRIKNASVVIQNAWRKHKGIQKQRERIIAVVKIQSFWRMTVQRRKYISQVKAAKSIQLYYTNFKLTQRYRTHFVNLKQTTVWLQSKCRAKLERGKYLELKYASIVIQSWWKMQLVKKQYLATINAAVVIQKYYRSYHSRVDAVTVCRRQKENITKIQSIFRGYLVRKQLRKQKEAAIVIQSSFQVWHARKIYRQKIQSVKIIQSSVRMWITRKNYINKINSINLLQRKWRATLEMREQRKSFRIKRGAVITLQAFWKGSQVRNEIKELTLAAVKIQSSFRGWRLAQNFRETVFAALIIQKWWRNILLAKACEKEIETRSAIVIQKYFKCWQERKRVKEKRRAAVKLQAFWRMYRERKFYQNLKTNIVIIQKWWRSHLEVNKIRFSYLYVQGCIILIQAHSRGLLARRTYKKLKIECDEKSTIEMEAAIKIQSWWRGVTTQNSFLRKREAIIKLQRYWRGAIKMLIAREYFIYLRRASIILQSVWRARNVRIEIRKITAAIIIQRAIRSWLVRRSQEEEERNFVIENFVKAAKRNLAAIKIQRWFRCRRYYKQNLEAVIMVQRQIRTFILRRKFLRIRKSVVTIQRRWRLKYAEIKEEKVQESAVVIQALWRGYAIRKRFRKNRRITMIRERLIEANTNRCESKTIANRTESAVYMLTHYKDIKRTLIALMVLDTCTRWSSACCEKLSGGSTLNDLLFLLKSANRSIPHMQILNYVLNTLITCAKSSVLLPQVLQLPNLVPLITQLMKIYYEKGPAIFVKCCTLLYILTSSQFEIADIYSSKTMEDLTSIVKVMERKMSIKEKSGANKRASAKMILSPSDCPSLTAEWAMRPKDKREFSEPLSGIFTLKKTLESKIQSRAK